MADDKTLPIPLPETKPWLSVNITYIITFWLLALWSSITIALIWACIKSLLEGKPIGDLTVVLSIWTVVSGRASTPIDFFMGSSKGSADKQITLDKLTTPTPTPGVSTVIEKKDTIADPAKP